MFTAKVTWPKGESLKGRRAILKNLMANGFVVKDLSGLLRSVVGVPHSLIGNGRMLEYKPLETEAVKLLELRDNETVLVVSSERCFLVVR